MPSFAFTYQTRLAAHPAFDALGRLMGTVMRDLHADVAAGNGIDAVKPAYLARYGIPGRYYNGVRQMLQGVHDGVRKGRERLVGELGERIAATERKVATLKKTEVELLAKRNAAPEGSRREKLAVRLAKVRQAIHGKARKIAALGERRVRFEREATMAVPPVCFGTAKLFNAQHHRAANGYTSHAEWKAEWQSARSSQFLIIGSHEEVSGNKTCRARLEADGTVTLALRLPGCLEAEHGTHLTIPGIRFGYGHEEFVAAIRASEDARPAAQAFQAETKRLVAEFVAAKAGMPETELAEAVKAFRAERRRVGKQQRDGFKGSITYRFVRDAIGWRLFATIHRKLEPTVGDLIHGALGVDLNQDHLAVMPVDGTGNPLKALARVVPLDLHDASSDRSKAVMGDAVKVVVEMARRQRRPIAIEDLDFQRKKAALKETHGPKAAKRLSSFAYSLFRSMLVSRAARMGVRVIEVDAAYSSHAGRCWCARRLGISVHLAATAILARRALGVSEEVAVPADIAVGDGRRVTLAPPARTGQRSGENAWRHVRRLWRGHHRRYQEALKARDGAASRQGGRSAVEARRRAEAERCLQADQAFLAGL